MRSLTTRWDSGGAGHTFRFGQAGDQTTDLQPLANAGYEAIMTGTGRGMVPVIRRR